MKALSHPLLFLEALVSLFLDGWEVLRISFLWVALVEGTPEGVAEDRIQAVGVSLKLIAARDFYLRTSKAEIS
jgi:hypothetical protein